MNAWLVAATALTFGYVLCGWVIIRGRMLERFVASQMAALITVLELEILAQGFGEAYFIDLAMALALLSFPAAIVYCYFYARWI